MQKLWLNSVVRGALHTTGFFCTPLKTNPVLFAAQAAQILDLVFNVAMY